MLTSACGSKTDSAIAGRRRQLPPPGGTPTTTPNSEECFAFASFRLYPKQRSLMHDDDPVAIGGRAFDMLLRLVSQAGVVISVNDLISDVWPNVTVGEANLRVQMGVLRKVLSQCDEATRAIETIPLRGYCFVLPVSHHLESDMASAFPLTGLPALLNPVIARDEAIEVISEALDERRLVTITGPGGIGKTTVAVTTANRYAAGFQGDVAFVDLSHVTDGEGLKLVVAKALGIETRGEAIKALCSHLRNRAVLLVLDTCEHIVDPVAQLAETLLTHCANLRLLATSREALRATGEWTHRLPPLTFPAEGEAVHERNVACFSAMTLFIDRVRSATRYEAQARDLPVFAEICRRLDGIPLALEFAAARAADLGIHQIAAHLDDLFTILTLGRRTALPRHRTLSATLEWSYSLLSDDEQRMLVHLAKLGCAFTTESAIAAGGHAGCARPPDTLCGLYEKSLLSVDMQNDSPIYRLLDTTRVYMASKDLAARAA